MKVVVFALLATVGTGVAFKSLTSLPKLPTLSSSTTSESVTVKSATVNGNVTDQRLSSNSETVTKNKQVVKFKVDKSRVVYLNDEVTYASSQGVANKIKELAASSNEPIYLLIDSPGGSVLDGATVISEIESSKAPVNTVCTRLCASMGAMIHSYGAKRYATDRSILMYHPAAAAVQGQVPNMLSMLTTINRYTDKMVANITSRSKLNKETYEKLIAYELWIDAEDALDKGLIDNIVNLDVASSDGGSDMPQPDQNRTSVPKRHFTIELTSPHPELWERNARQN